MSISKVFYKSPHNYDLLKESDSFAEVNTDPSTTVQSHAEDADLNVIMRRYNLTGAMPPNLVLPSYGDFAGVNDFQSALNAVLNAQEAFDSIPADVRSQFGNSPQKFLEFVSDAKNLPRMRELGLAKPEVPAIVPMKVEVVNSAPPSAEPPKK